MSLSTGASSLTVYTHILTYARWVEGVDKSYDVCRRCGWRGSTSLLCGCPPSLPPCCRSLAREAKAAACCRRRRTLMRRPSPWGGHLWLEQRGRRGRWCTSAAAGRKPLVSPNPNPTRPLATPSEPTPQPPGGSCASVGSLLSEGSGELARPATHRAPERPSSTTTSGGAVAAVPVSYTHLTLPTTAIV